MRRPLDRARILRRTDDQPTLPARVKRIMRKYSATMLLPGPVVPILGPERVAGSWSTPAGYDNTTVGNGASVTVTAGTAVGARAAVALQPLDVGKTYRVTARCLSQTATTGFYVREGSVPGNGTTVLSSPGLAAGGFYEATFTATRTDYNVLTSANVAASYAFSDISAREILGYQNTYSSFVAGNYRESTGQNLAAVDQQVGLVIDAGQQPGSELVLNGGFDTAAVWQSMPSAGSAVVAGGVLTVTRTTEFIASAQPINFVAGKLYDINFSGKLVSGSSALTIALRIGGNITGAVRLQHSVAGSPSMTGYSIKYFCANTETLWLQAGAGNAPGVVEFDNISVRELPGINASQATSGFQPYLRKVPKTLGPNLVSNGDFANGLAGWSLYGSATGQVVNGEAEVIAAATNSRLERNIPGIAVGKEYWASASIRGSGQATSLTVIRGAAGNYGTIATSGSTATSRKAEFGFVATGADAIVQFLPSTGTGVGTGYVDDVAVCEVLEWTYAWQFEGTDDRLSLSAVPFQMSDDHFVVVGARQTGAGVRCLFGQGTANATANQPFFGFNSLNELNVYVRNDAGLSQQIKGPAIAANVIGVYSYLRRATGALTKIKVDGVDVVSSSASLPTSVASSAGVGSNMRPTPAEHFNGHIHCVILGKGAITDAELLVLEKFAASLQGRSL
jgi:hypothetical protein